MNATCKNCGGSGWVIAERSAISGASRCACSISAHAGSNRPTLDDMTRVIVGIAESDVIPFFPKSPKTLAVIAASMLNYIFDYAALEAFARAYVENAKKYEGVAGMREIYQQYVGGTQAANPGDLEQAYLVREIEENEQRLLAYKRQYLLESPHGSGSPVLLVPGKIIEDAPLRTPGTSFGSSRSFNQIQDILEGAPTLSPKEREQALERSVKLTPVRSEAERLQIAEDVRRRLREREGQGTPV